MLLVTGGTGFIGRAIIRQLNEMGHPVRILLRPSSVTPKMPLSVPMEVVVCSLDDQRGLRSAMRGVDAVIHLTSAENSGIKADFQKIDIDGTRNLAAAALDSNVPRVIYLSHLGADRASAYPILKAKGIAESILMQEGLRPVILRCSLVYGPGDHFTRALIRQALSLPRFFLLPGDGSNHIQPLRVEDLAAVVALLVEENSGAPEHLAIGGPESLMYRDVVKLVLQKIGVRKNPIPISPAYLRILSVMFEKSWQTTTLSIPWLDYFASDRTCDLDTLPRRFGLIPERMTRGLNYLSPML